MTISSSHQLDSVFRAFPFYLRAGHPLIIVLNLQQVGGWSVPAADAVLNHVVSLGPHKALRRARRLEKDFGCYYNRSRTQQQG